MTIDLRRLCNDSNAKLFVAEAIGIDRDAGEVVIANDETISFDALSIGVGSVPLGIESHCDMASVVSTKPMQTFARRLKAASRRFDRSNADHSIEPINTEPNTTTHNHSRKRIAVVGGGAAGIELALCLATQSDARDILVTIFTSASTVGKGMRRKTIRMIERILHSRGVTIISGHKVVEVGENDLVTDDGKRHGVDVVVWTTGAAPPKWFANLPLEKDRSGFLATRPTLQSMTDPRIFAVGNSGTVIDSPSDKAGVYAVRQSPILWHNLNALFEGGRMQNFTPQRDFLRLLNTGDGKAVLQYGPLTMHGRWCWHLKTFIDKRFVHPFQKDQT